MNTLGYFIDRTLGKKVSLMFLGQLSRVGTTFLLFKHCSTTLSRTQKAWALAKKYTLPTKQTKCKQKWQQSFHIATIKERSFFPRLKNRTFKVATLNLSFKQISKFVQRVLWLNFQTVIFTLIYVKTYSRMRLQNN